MLNTVVAVSTTTLPKASAANFNPAEPLVVTPKAVPDQIDPVD